MADVSEDAHLVPMLPCGDIDEMAAFWTSLGLRVTYRQVRPNPYLALRRNAIDLHYYGLDHVDPEQSHSTCRSWCRTRRRCTSSSSTAFASGTAEYR